MVKICRIIGDDGKMIFEVPDENQKEPTFGVVWLSQDGRLKTKWHMTYKEAITRYDFVKRELGKDVGFYVKIEPKRK